MPSEEPDVLVVGAGNAGLCAALAAAERGASVLVIEKAPKHLRGGNTYFTGGLFRFAYDGWEQVRDVVSGISEHEQENVELGSYPAAQFYSDVMRVTEGLADPELVDLLVVRSFLTMRWMAAQGIPWVLAYGRQAFRTDEGRFRFWGGLTVEAVGGGKGLSDRQFELAERVGIRVDYETKGRSLVSDDDGAVVGVVVQGPHGRRLISPKAVVLACGGFEANSEMRTRYLGPGWEFAKVRGTRFNTGDGIRMALNVDAQSYGHWSGCHSVAWDLNAPNFGDRKVTDLFQKHSYPFGLIVNVHGKRFVDEGADFRNYTYAKYGREILRQPQRVAFQIFDSKVSHLLRDEYRIPQVSKCEASSIEELAEALGIDVVGLTATVSAFNASVQSGVFDPTMLDGKCTVDVEPPKSNWALPIAVPPFVGYAVTCGITFTFGGLRVSSRAQVLDTEDRPIGNLFAAGELVGGLFYENYPGGAGLMAGAVFGKIAGESASIAYSL